MQEEGGLRAQHYHAGMTPKQRIDVQNRWRSGGLQVLPEAAPLSTLADGAPSLKTSRALCHEQSILLSDCCVSCSLSCVLRDSLSFC